MSLRDEITADLAEAFDTDLADAVTEFTGSRVVGQGPYGPVTETRPEITETYTGRGVFGGYDLREVDGVRVLQADSRLTALQAEVTAAPGVPAIPKVGDTVNGMKVMHVGQDSAGVSWVLQLRGV